MSNVFAILLMAASAAATQPQAIALHARRLLDVRSGSVAEAYIVVRGDRIEAVAKSAPADAKVIDLGNATVLPGLIDCHVHVEADWNDLSATANLRQSSPRKTLMALKKAQEYLSRGFTTRSRRACSSARASSSPASRFPSPAVTPTSTRSRPTCRCSRFPTSPTPSTRRARRSATTSATASTG